MDYQPTCEACRDLYGRRVPSVEPPCDSCRPAFMEGNAEALAIYSVVQSQWIMGPSCAIDINHLAVWEAIDRYGVADKVGTFKKILVLSRWMLDRMNKRD